LPVPVPVPEWPVARGVDRGGVDVRVGVEVEIPEPLIPREPGFFDPSNPGAVVAVVALHQQQLRQEPLVAELLLVRGGRGLVNDRPNRRKTKPAASLVNSGGRGSVSLVVSGEWW
jgi:hypothetical protein